MLKNLSDLIIYYTAPHFSARYTLRHDINYIAKKYKLHGSILDVGCGQKPYKNIFINTNYTGIDYKDYSSYKGIRRGKSPDIYFDKKYRKSGVLPFKGNKFDVVCSFQVLEHVPKPAHLFTEMVRVLKNNCYMIITVPFIWGLHEEPNDYFRFTGNAIKLLAEDNSCQIVFEKKQGGLLSTFEVLFLNYLTELNKLNKIFYLITIPLYVPTLFISFISVFIEKHIPAKNVFTNYIFLIQKMK